MSELASYFRQKDSPWWSRYVSIRKSGQRAGGRDGLGFELTDELDDDAEEDENEDRSDSGVARSCLPKRRSHSGPERYVIVAISTKTRGCQ